MTNEQLVEQIARVLDACDPDRVNHELCLKQARAILPFITAARLEGVEAAAKALEADAMLCDCHAYEEDECACGAWCEWKTVPMYRAVEIVRGLIAGGSDAA